MEKMMAFKLTKQAEREFDRISAEMCAFLLEHCHPHISIMVDPNGAELVEGQIAYRVNPAGPRPAGS